MQHENVLVGAMRDAGFGQAWCHVFDVSHQSVRSERSVHVDFEDNSLVVVGRPSHENIPAIRCYGANARLFAFQVQECLDIVLPHDQV